MNSKLGLSIKHLTVLSGIAFASLSAWGAEAGYALVSPTYDQETILLDGAGKETHLWKSQYNHGGGARLLPDGAILSVVDMPKESTFDKAGLSGGGLEILEWNGDVRWRFWTATTHQMNVADAILLPNGNVLAIVLEWKSKEEAEKAGRDPAVVDEKGFLVPALAEFRPKGKSAGIPVWKWSLWDHLYQQKHPALANYHFPQPKPGCVDIAERSVYKSRHWLNPRAISYHEKEDLISFSIVGLKEPIIVDHSTSLAESATDEGGRHGHGGRILNRLGPAKPALSSSDASILSAEWNVEGTEDNHLSLSVIESANEGYTASTLNIQKDWSSKVGQASLVWKKAGSDGLSKSLHFAPTSAISAHLGHWITFSSVMGTVAYVDAKGSPMWTYQNTRGTRNFKLKEGVLQGGCCGAASTPEPGKPEEVRPLAPLTAVRYYSSGYLLNHP